MTRESALTLLSVFLSFFLSFARVYRLSAVTTTRFVSPAMVTKYKGRKQTGLLGKTKTNTVAPPLQTMWVDDSRIPRMCASTFEKCVSVGHYLNPDFFFFLLVFLFVFFCKKDKNLFEK